MTWTDGSLGCPQKGMSYTQALVEGELLLLRVDAGAVPVPRAPAAARSPTAPNPSAGYTVGG